MPAVLHRIPTGCLRPETTEAIRNAILAEQHAGKTVYVEAHGAVLEVPHGVEFDGMHGRAVLFRPLSPLRLA